MGFFDELKKKSDRMRKKVKKSVRLTTENIKKSASDVVDSANENINPKKRFEIALRDTNKFSGSVGETLKSAGEIVVDDIKDFGEDALDDAKKITQKHVWDPIDGFKEKFKGYGNFFEYLPYMVIAGGVLYGYSVLKKEK